MNEHTKITTNEIFIEDPQELIKDSNKATKYPRTTSSIGVEC